MAFKVVLSNNSAGDCFLSATTRYGETREWRIDRGTLDMLQIAGEARAIQEVMRLLSMEQEARDKAISRRLAEQQAREQEARDRAAHNSENELRLANIWAQRAHHNQHSSSSAGGSTATKPRGCKVEAKDLTLAQTRETGLSYSGMKALEAQGLTFTVSKG
jgi:hypothetical protein